jgi:hypothetical protein
MDPTDIAFIKGAVAFALLAATGLGAYWLRLRARLLSGSDRPALDRVQEDVAEIRAELEGRLMEVEERLDFAERRMLQDSPRKAQPDQPASLTPV